MKYVEGNIGNEGIVGNVSCNKVQIVSVIQNSNR